MDAQELDSLLSIALRDGEIDDNEKRVLENIINRIKEDELDFQLKNKIKEVEKLIA